MEEIPREPEKCSRCGGLLVLRKSAKGSFLGCSSFPQCRHTKAI
ncbi:topoisomerase DNA-binding C4 zinc finger domain-containing protein [Paenibacillus gansuensis]|uniref:Topoisomerase DNA-binding C4 zinc finger domain-containing protein n=1 Tax=Paenibacillus gansuensis TaxID=306542 RepID=A0ABW5PGM4_9BACL